MKETISPFQFTVACLLNNKQWESIQYESSDYQCLFINQNNKEVDFVVSCFEEIFIEGNIKRTPGITYDFIDGTLLHKSSSKIKKGEAAGNILEKINTIFCEMDMVFYVER